MTILSSKKEGGTAREMSYLREQKLTESQLAARSSALHKGIVRSGLPDIYREIPSKRLSKGSWAYITGGVGSGKTYLACSYLLGYIEDNLEFTVDREMWFPPKCFFVSALGYLTAVRDHYRNPDDWNYADIYLDTKFLVLDDVGVENATSWSCSELLRLIDHRYTRNLQTIVTSLYSLDELAVRLSDIAGDKLGFSMASRLFQNCEVVDLGMKDRRIA